MNTLDIKFYFLAISSLVFAYHANASESHLPQNLNEQLKKAFSVADAKTHGSFVIAGTFLANNPSVCAPDNIALKSALETAGYALGACKADLSKLDYRETGEHFVTNYLIREAGV